MIEFEILELTISIFMIYVKNEIISDNSIKFNPKIFCDIEYVLVTETVSALQVTISCNAENSA